MGIFNKLLGSEAKSRNTFDGSYVVFDVETTGLNRNSDRIIEAAIIEVDSSGIINQWTQRFNPEGPVGKTEIHGITDEDVKNAPLFKDASEDLVRLIIGKTIVAHNAVFDLAFLRSELTRAGWRVPFLTAICTLEASNYYLPDLGRRKLIDCCDAVGIEIRNQHTAFGDVTATANLMKFYLDPNKTPSPRNEDLAKIQQGSPKDFKFDPNSVKAAPKPFYRSAPKKSSSKETALAGLIKKLQKVELGQLVETKLKENSTGYLEKLLEYLADGDFTEQEQESLAELSKIYEFDQNDIKIIHEALLTALALHIQEDELISGNERAELKLLCTHLGFKETDSATFVKLAKEIKNIQKSTNTEALPKDWALGDPLRIGEKVVFTGCDPVWRDKLELATKKKGITVSSGVTKKTSLLVSDGSYSGNKARDAEKLGIRIVSPNEYEILLKYAQPPK